MSGSVHATAKGVRKLIVEDSRNCRGSRKQILVWIFEHPFERQNVLRRESTI